MDIEEILGSFVRRLNRHGMSFSGSADEVELPPPNPDKNYLLYLHVPYCTALCPFCSFHRVLFSHDDSTGYFEFLRREIELANAAGYKFDELYIGGGTPTVRPDEIAATINAIRANHVLRDISVETNPNHLTPNVIGRLQDVGVTRLSVGVQSFDDALLKSMHRYEHYGSGARIVRRISRARGAFETVNVDMIFNLPHQTTASLKRDLGILVDELEADQVSFYPLMTNESNPSENAYSTGRSEGSQQRHFYELIAERMLDAGYRRSSAWCFSRNASMYDEYIVDRDDYVGLGSGAFSYIDGALYANTFSIEVYGNLLANGRGSTISRRALSQRDQKRYYLLMRLFSGSLDKERAEEHFDGRFEHTLWPEIAALKTIDAIRDTGDSLILTKRGYYLWVVLMREFFTETNRFRDQLRHDIDREKAAFRTGATNNVRAETKT